MFTIKHVAEGKKERVVAAVSYSFDKDKNELIGYGSPNGDGTTSDVSFTTGHVYVMNDEGNTVGSYNLWLRTSKQQ